MPLVRVEVRNCYGLGVKELYREGNREEPKEILDGVTVAGLVGILRQLGDLAEFAAEVFHGLQEEVMMMSSRSRNLRARMKQIESIISPLEKVVLAQRNHLQFAYRTGSNWHAHIQCDENHFVYGDIPQFIMDSYEDCRSPPQLHLLDRFDPGCPGSCLKRYSDPSLFKRASVAAGEVSNEESAKDRECLKKKKKLSPRNGELAQGESFSYHSGRKQVAQLNVAYNSNQQMSNVDDQSSSVPRIGPTCIDFHPRYSMQSEEPESRESISSPVKRHYVDDEFLDYIFLQGKVSIAYDYIQINLSQDQAGCSSPSISWDEKIEALEAKVEEHDCEMPQKGYRDRIQEPFSPKSDVKTLGDTSLYVETAGKMNGQPSSDALPILEPDKVHLDDGESAVDHLIDAMNTIELDHQIDEHFSKLDERAVDNELEIGKHCPECQSSYSDSDGVVNSSMYNATSGHNPSSVSPKSTSVSFYSNNPVAVRDVFDSTSLVEKAVLPTQRATESSNLSDLPSVDSFGTGNIDGVTNEESVASTSFCNFRDDTSGVPMTNGTSSPAHQKTALETSDVTHVMFWTNGGLLGLETSKPPDLNVKNAIPQDPVASKDDKINTSNKHYVDKDSQKPNQIDNFKNIETGLDTESFMSQEHQESGTQFRKPYWKISPADLGIKLGIRSYSLSPNNAGVAGCSLPVNSLFNASAKNEENCRTSAQNVDLADRLQTSASIKKLLLSGDENTGPYSGYGKFGCFEQNNSPNVAYEKFSERSKGFFGCESSVPTPSSSPPLGHMKISFQPMDGVEAFKLKLKCLDRNEYHETSRDIFPSFQLVPEISIIRQNIGSDSDDETFRRSSLSDDCHSHQSESNSVQWESDQSHCGKDPDLYDALLRVSTTEPTAMGSENDWRSYGEIHHKLQFPYVGYDLQNYGCSIDSPMLETPRHSLAEGPRKYANPKDIVEPQGVQTLPSTSPVQWFSMKSHLDDNKDKREVFSEGAYFEFDPNVPVSTASQRPKPAPFDQEIQGAKVEKNKQLELQTSKSRREADQLKGIDEKEDFLHQIRSKLLNLRPTPKSKYMAPTSNAHASAILQKANAIRQVVGSDDGEGDSNWSDS